MERRKREFLFVELKAYDGAPGQGWTVMAPESPNPV